MARNGDWLMAGLGLQPGGAVHRLVALMMANGDFSFLLRLWHMLALVSSGRLSQISDVRF